MDPALQQQIIRSTADILVIAAPVLGSLWIMHKENREAARESSERWATLKSESDARFCKSDDRWAETTKAIAQETKERNRQFYELLRKMDESKQTST